VSGPLLEHLHVAGERGLVDEDSLDRGFGMFPKEPQVGVGEGSEDETCALDDTAA
jgi:hypothetical protein